MHVQMIYDEEAHYHPDEKEQVSLPVVGMF